MLGSCFFELGFEPLRVVEIPAFLEREIAELLFVFQVRLELDPVRIDVDKFAATFGVEGGFELRDAQQTPPGAAKGLDECAFVRRWGPNFKVVRQVFVAVAVIAGEQDGASSKGGLECVLRGDLLAAGPLGNDLTRYV